MMGKEITISKNKSHSSSSVVIIGGFLVFLSSLVSIKANANTITEATIYKQSIVNIQQITSNSNRSVNNITNRLNKLRERIEVQSTRKSLQECLEIGLMQNMQLAAGYASIQQQEFTLLATKRQYLPTLSLSSLTPFLGKVYTYSRTDTDYYRTTSQVVPTSDGTDEVLYSGGYVNSYSTSKHDYKQFAPYITLSWSFFQPSLWASIQAENAEVGQQMLVFNVTARSAVLQIQEAYFKLQSTQRLIIAFEEIYRANLEQVKMIEAQERAGLVDIGSVEHARTQLYSQLNQLIQYYQSLLQDSASLALAMNQPSDLMFLPSHSLEKGEPWTIGLDETIDQALALREEIKSYLQTKRAAIWNARSAIRKYLPVLSFQGVGYGYKQKGSEYVDSEPVQDVDYLYKQASIGIGLTWTLFDGGVYGAEADSYMASAKNAEYEAEYSRYTVREQVRKSYASYEMSILDLLNTKDNLDAAENSLAVNRSRFSVGLSDITTLVQGMQLLGQATENHIKALLQHNQSVAELYRYSAIWPEGIESLINERKQELKNDM